MTQLITDQTRSLATIAFVSVALLAGCSRREAAVAFETEPRAILASEGLKTVRAPQIAVSAANKISLLALYGDGGSQRVGFTMSHDGGDHFMAIKPVSEEGVSISAHGENNPEMVVAGRSVLALWEQAQADGIRDIVVARSTNEGMSFEKSVRVNDNKTASFHGFASIAGDTKGNVYVVWLDGRESSETPGTFDVYLAHSADRGATFGPNVRVAQSGCPCCRPTVAVGTDGRVFVAWRKVFPGSIRDMMVSVSTDSGQTFSSGVRVAEDKWQIAGCPESGASLSVAKDRLYVAWMTGGDDSRARLQVAWSDDGGAHFRSPENVSKEIRDPNHPYFVQAANGRLLVFFQGRPVSPDGKQWSPTTAFVAQIDGGEAGEPRPLARGSGSVSYPVAAVGPNGDIFAAWTSPGEENSSAMLLRGELR